jgi:hypothetical protein
MRWTTLKHLLWPACGWIFLASCSSTSPQPSMEAQPGPATQREAYTAYEQLEINGELVGFLLFYQEIPGHAQVERTLPTGSIRIQDVSFEDVGFISPRREWFRHTIPGSSSNLGIHNLQAGLRMFFATDSAVQRSPLLAVLD